MTWTRERLKELEGAINTVQSNPYDPYDSMVLEAARAFLSLKKTGGWLPIAEAPRDGEFLGYKNTWIRPRIMRRVTGGIESVTDKMCLNPTHFMPLPAAPEDGE